MDLRALRERAGLRITNVAHELKCAESSIRNWEKGRTTPKLEVWQVFYLRKLYQCTEEELEQAVMESMQNGEKP
jgi:predicted transcriptional regulator